MRKVGDNQRSWKGQTEIAVEPVRHRWQMEGTAVAAQMNAPLRRLRRALAFLLLLAIAMLCGFVFLLLHAPLKTPVIAVGATSYVWPMPPNSWVKEDVDGLTSLHGKAIHLKDSSKAWQTKSTCLEDLQTQLRETRALAERSGIIVLYFNMHGAVNEEGDPCLVPPGASYIASTQWIKIEELTSTIVQNAPTGVKVLLAFDCVHQQVNWNAAQLNNTFVDRLKNWAEQFCPESIVVLSACASDQRSWSGADLHGSIFGRELRLGLAGEADRQSTPSRPGSGNGDGAVSVQELSRYLTRTVNQWAQAHRGTSQTPTVVSKVPKDFRVSWALKSGELARQASSVQYSDLAVPTPSSIEMDSLWRTMDELRTMGLYSYDPKSWADLEQKLVWLERLFDAGAGYAELSSKQIFPSMSKRLKETLERAKANIQSNNEVAKANILKEGAESVTVPSLLPSLALQERIGEIPSALANTLRGKIASASIDNEQTVSGIVTSLGVSPQFRQLNELTFLGIAKKFDCTSCWPDHSAIQGFFELRDRCEFLAVHGDVRAHRWRRPNLMAADKTRRKAEDQLLVGPGDLQFIDSPVSSWDEFRNSLAQIDGGDESPKLRTESAFRLRDQGFAEIAYLANWICSPETVSENLAQWNLTEIEKGNSEGSSPFLREELVIQELKRLINGLHELSEVLQNVSDTGVGTSKELNELMNQVKRDFDSLKGRVQDQIERVGRNSTASAKAIREIDALLELPFIAADQRVALRKLMSDKLREVVASESTKQSTALASSAGKSRLASRNLSETADETLEIESVSKQARYADRLRIWGTHPLGELLLLKDGLSLESMSAKADATKNDKLRELIAIDEANSRLRRSFESMQLFSPNRVRDWCESAEVKHTFQAEPDAWSQTSFAERYERAMAPLCPIKFESDNSLLFRRLAFKDLLHWYADRIIEDFYADPYVNLSETINSESYFERSVKRVLDYATTISGEMDGMAESIRNAKDRVQILGPIARNGIRTSVKSGLSSTNNEQVQYDVSVTPTIGNSAGRPWKLQIPKGQGALLLRNSDGIMKTPRLGVAIPIDGVQAAYKFIAQRVDPTRSSEAVLVYRGHEFRAPVAAGQGIVVDFQPKQFDWAEVVLFGQTKRQSSIVFVLDCSWSMGEEIPVEAISVKSQSRLEMAKDNVLNMLGQLASRPDARIGVRLFGHRLGWSRPTNPKAGSAAAKTQILAQPNYTDPIPNDLVPSRDVEEILPLGRFSTDMVGGLANKLSKIVPWGQSPLYLSIIESFHDFDADDESTAKSIVVITDGDNFQFNASGRPGGESSTNPSAEEVLRAWSTNKIPLFILGVGVNNPAGAKDRTNLIDLAERTGGRYYDIENGSDLLRALAEQLSIGTYQVSKLDSKRNNSRPVAVGEAKLNASVEVSPISSEPYEVAFQSTSKTVQFQGGESLELHLNEDGQDIISMPYNRFSPTAATLVRAGESGRLIARVHRPSQHNNSVDFPISFQDPDSHFTPRPTQLWIEVSPVSTGTQSPRQTYLFCDANFESKTPVPMVLWNASNWPANATGAEVQIWAKYGPTPNLQTITLDQVKQNSQRYAEGIPVDGVEGVKITINLIPNRDDAAGLIIQVTETHSDRSLGVGSIRIGLDDDLSIVPSRVTRRFESANNIAVHTFEFDALNAQSLLAASNSRISIQSRSALQLGAWQLQSSQPIRVEIASIPESLPQAILPSAVIPK
jgi:Caspase domain